ncbi:hypothetical protein [Intestinirhabdus alba]|jgi:hypothetical protein|uniref:Uncharacterized protein n=1 Tax=Intestinirhabdus alba TaxID=2899544 RepID=A0A6L6INW9_9ENTR|nr:hypothetical protein [Intestinirhabdus alba]MTH47607.1 hypothetical protein [Intestinirhabdus alba]
MPKYNIYTKIESNVPTSDLFYDLNVYKTDANNKKHVLLSVTQQPITSGYYTQPHETNETDDDLSVIYIIEMNLYRKHGGKLISVFSSPSKKMYTLGEMVSGQAYSKNKRENVCYFETKTQTKPVNDKGEDNIHHVQITCMPRFFVSLEHPIGDPLDPFTKNNIKSELDTRKAASLLGPEGGYYPDQYYSMLCGPAAFYYCLMMDRYDIYEQLVWELWSHGKAMLGDFLFQPSTKTMKVDDLFAGASQPRVSAIDWITMASLRDSSNNLLRYESVRDKVSAITLWGDIEKWMLNTGAQKIFSNISLYHSSLNDICKLNSLMSNDVHIFSLISAGMLQQGADVPFKDHWIVWGGKLKLVNGGSITNETSLEELVSLRLFSWGEVKDNSLRASLTLGEFLRHTFGGMVFKKIP